MRTVTALVTPTPGSRSGMDWVRASEVFLRRPLAAGSRRVYRLALDRVGQHLPKKPLDGLTAGELALALGQAYPEASAASWNRVLATVRSFLRFATKQGWLSTDLDSGLERRKVVIDYNRALSREEVERLLTLRTAHLRDRALWTLLYETAARSREVLMLNVEDVDLHTRCPSRRELPGPWRLPKSMTRGEAA